MKRVGEGSLPNFGTPGRGRGATEREAAGAGGAGRSAFQQEPRMSALQMQNQSKGGWGLGGLCSSFHRPKDPGGLALFPNLKIFQAFGSSPVVSRKVGSWGGVCLETFIMREDEGVGKEGGPKGLETCGVRRPILCSQLSSASVSPLQEPQYSSQEGRTGCRCSQTLSLLRKGGSSESTLEAWSEGLAPGQALGRAAGPPGVGGGEDGGGQRSGAEEGEAVTLPKRLRGWGRGEALVPGWERRSGARPLGCSPLYVRGWGSLAPHGEGASP